MTAKTDDGPVVVTTPVDRATWQRVYDADPAALVTQSPAWSDAMAGCGWVDASRHYRCEDGTEAVLPLVRRRGPTGAALQMWSLPDAWGFGGILAPVVDAGLVAAVMADLRRRRVAQVRIRPNPLHSSAWAGGSPPGLTVLRRGHVLSLDGDADHIWAHQFTSSCRRAIRSAEKSGLVVDEDRSGQLVPAFHRLLMESVDRWAGQQHEPPALARWRAHRRDPEAKFQSWADALGSGCRVLIARRGGDVLAGMVVLQGHNAHMTRGAMDRQLMGTDRGNELLMWHAIRGAVEVGCRHFHMGESGSSVSLSRYKEKYGARPYDYAEHGFEHVPLTRIDRAARGLVKRAVRFRED